MHEINILAQNLTVLYVEDDAVSREQLKEIFELIFKSVEIAFDGQDAMDKYNISSYDIIITDINMPRMNGMELINLIKQKKQSQKIIVLSAHNNSEYLLKAIELDVDGFILKPIKTEQLRLTLNKIISLIDAENILAKYHNELEKKVLQKTAKLEKQLITDELTGLMNRKALFINSGNSVKSKIVLLMNIDNFDSMNIVYGYQNGDLILKEVAGFLETKIFNNSTLYRIGSDEFVMLFKNCSLEEVNQYAQSLQNDISRFSIKLKNIDFKITFTIAIAEGVGCLLKQARIALKEAHRGGKNRINIYTKNSSIERLQSKIQEYMPKLREAIINRHITPYFQAIINNKTGKIEKYECLARIVDGDTIQSPFEFIDIAQLTGMITEITKVMIDKSFKVFQDNNIDFSINISEYDLSDGYLRTYLLEKTTQYNIRPSRVVIEVLEGISTSDAQYSLNQLMDLKKDGFEIAIDDFGAQNSNFERVHAMHVDYIKIDGSFIKEIHTNKKSYSIAKTISDFSKNIGVKVIAEYVHSKEIQDIILELGIDYSQGYYFSEPKSFLDTSIAQK